jgi:hypothetical protein
MTAVAPVPDAASRALLDRLARIRERARARRDPEAAAGLPRPARTRTTPSPASLPGPFPAHARLTLAERRVLQSVIAQIDRRAPGVPTTAETPFEVTAAGLAALCAIPEPHAYALLAQAADRLARRWVAIEAPDPQDPRLARTKTPLVHAIDCFPAAGRLRLYLAPRILPYLSRLAAAFARERDASAARVPGSAARGQRDPAVPWEARGAQAPPPGRRPRSRQRRSFAREARVVQALPEETRTPTRTGAPGS